MDRDRGVDALYFVHGSGRFLYPILDVDRERWIIATHVCVIMIKSSRVILLVLYVSSIVIGIKGAQFEQKETIFGRYEKK